MSHDFRQFDGFSREVVDFLLSLGFKNTMDLLPENKIVYKSLISEPLTLLFYGLTPVALDVSDTLITKPSKCVSSMYNDMRFSKGTPLKEYMYIRFREPNCDSDVLGLYFDMGYQGYSYGIRIYNQTSAGMERIRQGVLGNKKAFARELINISDMGMAIKGNKYVRDRYPDEKPVILKELLNSRSFHIGRDCPVGDAVFSGELQEEIAEAYCGLKGMYSLLKKSLYVM